MRYFRLSPPPWPSPLPPPAVTAPTPRTEATRSAALRWWRHGGLRQRQRHHDREQ